MKEMARVTIRRDGRAVDFYVRCSNDPTVPGGDGWWKWTMTTQMCKAPTGLVPFKRCPVCGESYPALSFLKHQKMHADGSSLISDDPVCYRCKPPPVFQISYRLRREHGRLVKKLAVRIELRDETGRPITWFDKKTRRHRAMKEAKWRLMTGTNHSRMQPYDDRGHDKDGVAYPKRKRRVGPRLPLGDLAG